MRTMNTMAWMSVRFRTLLKRRRLKQLSLSNSESTTSRSGTLRQCHKNTTPNVSTFATFASISASLKKNWRGTPRSARCERHRVMKSTAARRTSLAVRLPSSKSTDQRRKLTARIFLLSLACSSTTRIYRFPSQSFSFTSSVKSEMMGSTSLATSQRKKFASKARTT